MAHLTLKGLSDDGRRLVLVDEDGVEFTVDLDARLRAAARGDGGEPRREKQMDSSLRPRDIQARIRSGETPEAVADAANTSVDKIMAFAAPVLAERQHVADRAQRSSVRRRGGDAGASGGARTLGDVVAFHLRSLNVDPSTVTWDAWRREDGRWSLTGDFSSTKRNGSAHFTFDAPGNYVVAENDDARWLLGEQLAAPDAPAPRDDLRHARERRLTVASTDDELPLGDDALGLLHDPDESSSLGAEQPLEAFLDDEPPTRDVPAVRHEEPEPAPEPAPEAGAEADEPPAEEPARRPAKKKGRASVPSWDEIMFGGGKND